MPHSGLRNMWTKPGACTCGMRRALQSSSVAITGERCANECLVATREPKFEIPLKALWLPAGAGVKSGRTIFYHMHMLYPWYIGVLARADAAQHRRQVRAWWHATLLHGQLSLNAYSPNITALCLALMGCICYTPMQHMASEVRA